MKICVLIKQVPNEDAIIKISPNGDGIIKDNLTYCTNEPDTYALEEALLIKESVGDCEVVACTMGKDSSSQILKEALAKGADRAILINNDNLEDIDPLGISKVISNVLQKESFDLILSGLQSDDSGHSQTGLLIAELLNMTHASLVVGTEILSNEKIKVKKELESGWFQWAEMDMPSSISIQSGLNKPRYASLKGIMGAKKKQLDKYNPSELEINIPKSHIETKQIYIPQKSKETKYIDGDTDSIVQELIKILKDDIKAIN
jgi:electron transfer flavoprotein beta subunit